MIVSTRFALILSALVGGVVCTLADLVQKSEASAVLLIGTKLTELFSSLPAPNVIAICLVLALAVAISLIFEATTKKGAFYLGASILAILMTATPYKVPPGFKTEPNSVEVNLSIETTDHKPVAGALVTLRDQSGAQVLSRTRPPGARLRFFQDGGTYQLTVEASGYKTKTESLTLDEGSGPQSKIIRLEPSTTPLFIQRLTQ